MGLSIALLLAVREYNSPWALIWPDCRVHCRGAVPWSRPTNVNDDAPLIIEPPEDAVASIIWLHGLGADGHDFEPIVAELGDAATRKVRYVFPHAPRIPVTINGGMVMRAWYNIKDTDLSNRADEPGVRASAAILEGLIEEEIARGLASTRILLAGFSQGGAIALHTGLRYGKPLAGILALSTYLPLQETAAAEFQEANRDIPIFLAHGSQDPVIPLALSEHSRQFLVSLGYHLQCHTYPMPHSVCPEEIRDMAIWLERVLS
ncbi:MAG: carboxylesterase [Proteobacteria bacterium]|nr:carboxylesterase [Pseudomonadota bacterium]